MSKSSNYTGVSWRPERQAWEANIYHNGRKHHVGTFPGREAERQAAIAYDKKAISLGLIDQLNILKPLKKAAA